MENFGLHKIVDSEPTIPVKVMLSLPRNWKMLDMSHPEMGKAFRNTLTGLVVVASTDTMENGDKYLHISCSHGNKLPTWDELVQVKNTFIGEDVQAFQVLPRKEDYVNLMPY